MNRKAIKTALSRKFEKLLDSVTDENVRMLMRKNTIISGGSIVSMLLREKVKDYDLYFANKETVQAVAEYYVKVFNETSGRGAQVVEENGRIRVHIQSVGVDGEDYDPSVTTEEKEELESIDPIEQPEDEEKHGKAFRPIFLTPNAISLSSNVQLVIRFYGPPAEIHKNYDFVHCTSYWTSWDEELVLPAAALEAILAKQLIYIGSLYPVCSIIRTRKFIRRGWTCNAGQYLKMAYQVSELDLSNIKHFEDQLVGVDSAYFYNLITQLKEKMGDNETIEKNYLFQVINSIF